MLLEAVAQHARLARLLPELADALAWLADRDWPATPDGRHELAGERIVATVSRERTAPAAARRFESHRAHLDIHCPIDGPEAIGWAPAGSAGEGEPAGTDLWFHAEPAPQHTLLLAPGWCAIFWPGELHRPLGAVAAPGPLRKCVIKVRWPC
ncbi:MAG: YhcH/YjgK/YiaL family protein [Planctomycetota bacterium]|nr:YhcH/YjgK/YiaL family protein [Planctomycetota bacterium]MCX8039139.1 YhcH/YjgK/YiaL family protein [Planctomycetota bacterium]MDW8372569.1 YhcH/YjgK/YiaL family protein [Planctomycetota bacterium]